VLDKKDSWSLFFYKFYYVKQIGIVTLWI
jgi:hypothetical protein